MGHRQEAGAERIRQAKAELEAEAKASAEAKLKAAAEAQQQREAEGRKKSGPPAAPPSTTPEPKAQKNFTDPESRRVSRKPGQKSWDKSTSPLINVVN